jgi:hypothetical protein
VQDSYLLLSFFAVGAAAVGGGLAGWLGAAVVALVARLERRIVDLARLGDDQPRSHPTFPAGRGSRAH